MNKKVILLSLLIILSIVTISGCIGDNLFNNSEDKNITLINESTSVLFEIYDDGEKHSIFNIEGVLKDLPQDLKGYQLKSVWYDENKKLMKECDESLQYIAKYSKKSEPARLGSVGFDGIKNVSIVELKIYNPDEIIIFDKNVTFNMKNNQTNYLNKTHKTQEEINKEKKDKYFNSKEFNDSYWNSI